MRDIKLNWIAFKSVVSNKKLFIQEKSSERWGYRLEAFDELINYTCDVDVEDSAGADVTDYETNYQSNAGQAIIPRDDTGVVLTKSKIMPSSWHYQLRGFIVEIGTLECVTALTANYTTFPHITVTHYDAQDNVLTTQLQMLTAVKTYIDYEPPYDYAAIGATVHQSLEPAPELYIGALLAPDIPLASGGSVEFAGGINLKYVGKSGEVKLEGRDPTIAPYDPVTHTGKLRITLNYPIASSHQFHLLLELFKPPGV